jgi:hypothetical protein
VKHADVVMLARVGDNVDGSPKNLGESNGANKAIIKRHLVGGRSTRRKRSALAPVLHAWSDRQPTSEMP